MQIEDIDKLADLSRIDLLSEEKEALKNDLGAILGYINQIESVPVTEDVSGQGYLKNVMREDGEAYTSDAYKEKILKESPEQEDGYFKVEQIL